MHPVHSAPVDPSLSKDSNMKVEGTMLRALS